MHILRLAVTAISLNVYIICILFGLYDSRIMLVCSFHPMEYVKGMRCVMSVECHYERY